MHEIKTKSVENEEKYCRQGETQTDRQTDRANTLALQLTVVGGALTLSPSKK